MSAENLLAMESVHKWYGNFHALDNCSIDVARGEKIVVCGPSGSGKSTLIRCINRIEQHDGGHIAFEGVTLDDSRKAVEARKGIGMVFQQFNLFPHLTVLENVMLAPTLVKRQGTAAAREKAMSLLARVRIVEQAEKYPGQLSGGQQQRVDRKSTRLNSSHVKISYAVFCLKKKKKQKTHLFFQKKKNKKKKEKKRKK